MDRRPARAAGRIALLLALLPGTGALPGCADESDRGGGGGAGGGGHHPPAGWIFTEVAREAGLLWTHRPFNPRGSLDAYDHGNGVAAGDFDGDGHEDVLLLSQCGPAGFFLGRGDGTFTDRSDRLGLPSDGIPLAVAAGDFDEDGRTDFYVTFVRRPNALLRQGADGAFTDVAAERGAGLEGHWSGASFADFDGDGDLDIVVAGNLRFTKDDVLVPAAGDCPAGWEGRPVYELLNSTDSHPTALLVNGGAASGWTFTEEAAARGIPPGGAAPGDALGFGDVTVLDFDRDGDLDLYLPEMFRGRSRLLENDGTGRFTDATAARVPRASFGASGAAAEDFNGDGRPDLLVTDMHSDMWVPFNMPIEDIDTGVRYRNEHHGPGAGVGDNPDGPFFGNTLWLSRPDGGFDERDLEWGAETFNPWGALAGDFDNDGRADAFVPSGMSNPYRYFPDVFLHNLGDRFEEMQVPLGFHLPEGRQTDPDVEIGDDPLVHSTRGSAAADFDGDGDLDIVSCAWTSGVRLWRNDLPRGRRWLSVDLRGRAPRDPVGAEVEVVAGGRTQVRWMQGARGYLSQSSRRVHFGLGDAEEVESVSVRWPDGSRTRLDRPRADRVLVVEQE